MNYLKNVYFSLKYDLTQNRWLRDGEKSPYYGHVLMFHHVTDEFVDINPSCKCSVEEFRTILSNYQEAGFEFVSVEKALDYIKNKTERKFVVVTFDDIPDNVYTNAYPILKQQQIPFVVFISIKMIDRCSSDISTRHLIEMSQDRLCTVGAHTMTHPMLREVNNSKWEITQSKVELEKMLNKPVKYFAYPFGRYSAVSKRVVDEIKRAGFECAFCTVEAPLTLASSENLFFLPRIVPVYDKVKEFKKGWTVIDAIKLLVVKTIKRILNKE